MRVISRRFAGGGCFDGVDGECLIEAGRDCSGTDPVVVLQIGVAFIACVNLLSALLAAWRKDRCVRTACKLSRLCYTYATNRLSFRDTRSMPTTGPQRSSERSAEDGCRGTFGSRPPGASPARTAVLSAAVFAPLTGHVVHFG